MVVSMLHGAKQPTAQSLLFGMLGTIAALGLGVVAFAFQQELPDLGGGPLPSAPLERAVDDLGPALGAGAALPRPATTFGPEAEPVRQLAPEPAGEDPRPSGSGKPGADRGAGEAPGAGGPVAPTAVGAQPGPSKPVAQPVPTKASPGSATEPATPSTPSTPASGTGPAAARPSAPPAGPPPASVAPGNSGNGLGYGPGGRPASEAAATSQEAPGQASAQGQTASPGNARGHDK